MGTGSTKSCLAQGAGEELGAVKVKVLVLWLDLSSDEEKGWAGSLLATSKQWNGKRAGSERPYPYATALLVKMQARSRLIGRRRMGVGKNGKLSRRTTTQTATEAAFLLFESRRQGV